MKLLSILALCLLLSACGVTMSAPSPGDSLPPAATPSQAFEPSPSPVPEPSAPPALSSAPELSFETERSEFRRTTLNTKGLPLSVYFEVPVFPETSEANRKMNAFFTDLTTDFFSTKNEDLTAIWTSASEQTGAADYHFDQDAVLWRPGPKLVSVTIMYYWFAGGVNDYGSDSYTFDAGTGERLRLTDLVEGTEEELKREIIEAVKEKTDRIWKDEALRLDWIEDYALDQFEFFVDKGQVTISFDKYEAADGAHGGFDVELPLELKPAWRDTSN